MEHPRHDLGRRFPRLVGHNDPHARIGYPRTRGEAPVLARPDGG